MTGLEQIPPAAQPEQSPPAAQPEQIPLAAQLARFADGLRSTPPPAEVAASVRQRVLDVLGLCAAATSLPTSQAALAYVSEHGGVGQAHAIGLADPVPAPLAAFANGVLAHSLDYDDTHLPSVLHPSASVVPAALAAAQRAGSSGHEVVAAIAAGLEVCVRLGMAGYDQTAGNSTFFEHGQHATSICGALGGAVSAAMLYRLDQTGIRDALAVAASMASGIIESNRTGGTVKRMHCGWAANSAVSAALLVHHGFTGPPTVLEGRFGFFQAFLHGRYHPEAITDGLGTQWAVPDIFFKPYPANHFTHTAVDAARALRESGLRPQDIASIRLGVPAAVVRTIGEPLTGKQTPQTGYQAQFSGPYAIAAGLLGGSGLGVGLADYTDELACDPARRQIMAKVVVEADDECTTIFPHQFPAVVTVHTVDGRTLVQKVLANRGGPTRPLTNRELAAKFRDNTRHHLAADTMDDVEDLVNRLDQLPNIGSLMATAARRSQTEG